MNMYRYTTFNAVLLPLHHSHDCPSPLMPSSLLIPPKSLGSGPPCRSTPWQRSPQSKHVTAPLVSLTMSLLHVARGVHKLVEVQRDAARPLGVKGAKGPARWFIAGFRSGLDTGAGWRSSSGFGRRSLP